MAIAVVLAVGVWVDHANGIPFRIIWDLVWILIALIAIRIARLGVHVRRDQLIIRGFFRTRTFNQRDLAGAGTLSAAWLLTGRWLAADSLDSHLGGARTLILPGRIGPATRESA